MDSFAGVSGKALGPIFGSLPFAVLSFFGVIYPLSKISITKSQLMGVLLLLSLPSFGVWTSVASKEAVSVFFMGVILAAYFDVFEGNDIKNKALLVVAVYLAVIFKPQYMISIGAIFSFTYVSRRLQLKGLGKLFILSLSIFIGSFVLYFFRDMIDDLSRIMPRHFSLDGGSTRENDIWIEKYDVFKNAPYGMYLSFVGPTFKEALSKPTHMLAWVESMIILTAFGLWMLKYFLFVARSSRLNIMFISGFGLVVFWILFVHYPFGALNPGSAIRYREAFYAFLVCLFFYLYKKSTQPVHVNLNSSCKKNIEASAA
jgi:hypothetical protein